MSCPPTVLMIDDNPADCRLVKEMFAESEAKVDFHSVADGPKAFDFLSKSRNYASSPTPDLIVVDLNLPILGGKKILNLIKTDQRWKAIPVVVLSSSSLQEDIDECMELGAERYFTKPATVDDYLRVISEIDQLLKHLR
ncbi:MAG: response regulator [Planctomycetes bacterium]|nr:response regulator [Planctomycetota bacterium]